MGRVNMGQIYVKASRRAKAHTRRTTAHSNFQRAYKTKISKALPKLRKETRGEKAHRLKLRLEYLYPYTVGTRYSKTVMRRHAFVSKIK